MTILECSKTGRHWTYASEERARRAAIRKGLKDYTMAPRALSEAED